MSLWSQIRNWCGRWRRPDPGTAGTREPALLPRAFLTVLEDVLAWDNPQLSLGFIALVNVLFLVFVQLSVSFLEIVLMVAMFVTLVDALEVWLRHKRRTALLKQLAECENTRLLRGLERTGRWLTHCKEDFLALRESNPTKAFLLVNIVLGGVLVVGRAVSGALLLYLMAMSALLLPIASPYLVKAMKKIHQVAESDGEIDSLIPELSEQNLKVLNFESEASLETRHSVEPWLPEGAPPTDTSDSSEDDSGTMLPGLHPASHPALDPRDTDSSDDEYLPQAAVEEKLRSTLEVMPPGAPASWSAGVWGLRGALSSLVWATPPPTASRVSSADSSDGFEFIEPSDL